MNTLNKKHKDLSKEVWIGLVGVVPRPGNDLLGKAKQGFVNILALAASTSEYGAQVERVLDELGLDVTEIEDSEPLSERLSKWTVDPEISRLAQEVNSTGFARFGTFHVYEDEDESNRKARSAVDSRRSRAETTGSRKPAKQDSSRQPPGGRRRKGG